MSDAKDLIDWISEYHGAVEDKIEAALMTAGIIVVNDAKSSLRSSEEPSVSGLPPRNQTGQLRRSIFTVTDDEDGQKVQYVSAATDYAAKQEFGSSENWPHPFLIPALDRNESAIIDLLVESLK